MMKLEAPERRHAILYVRIKPTNRQWLSDLTKTMSGKGGAKLSESEVMDMLLDRAREEMRGKAAKVS